MTSLEPPPLNIGYLETLKTDFIVAVRRKQPTFDSARRAVVKLFQIRPEADFPSKIRERYQQTNLKEAFASDDYRILLNAATLILAKDFVDSEVTVKKRLENSPGNAADVQTSTVDHLQTVSNFLLFLTSDEVVQNKPDQKLNSKSVAEYRQFAKIDEDALADIKALCETETEAETYETERRILWKLAEKLDARIETPITILP